MEDGIAEESRGPECNQKQVDVLVRLAAPLCQRHNQHSQQREETEDDHHQGAKAVR